MAEHSRKGSLYEHFIGAWPVLLGLGLGLFWLGRNIETPSEIDDRVSSGIQPLQDRTEWIEAEIRRHESRGHSGTAEEMRALEERIRLLENRR